MADDTIAALSTPAGESAIAAIRLSGGMCSVLARECFGKKDVAPRHCTRAEYISKSGSVLDDVLFAFFKAPHSYTDEDMLEIYTHGNPYIVQTILEDLFSRGVRAATHGEFTRRAFESGRIDLSQAEAVSLMISARSEKSLAAARRQLGGELSRRINSMCDLLVESLARIEAYIDFSDEDLPPESFFKPKELLLDFVKNAEKLSETSRYGAVLRDGLNVSIVGEPNVGKSSLMNCMLGRDRAIVSPAAGTTRDFIVERANISGYCVNLTDTAGLRNSADEIESE
ncbi:MAG: 50S ribosome-binding GTPase, partial [Opitutales bacterium]|nr:50S ribosome-binding GTPase [Opitutales bacterium]